MDHIASFGRLVWYMNWISSLKVLGKQDTTRLIKLAKTKIQCGVESEEYTKIKYGNSYKLTFCVSCN